MVTSVYLSIDLESSCVQPILSVSCNHMLAVHLLEGVHTKTAENMEAVCGLGFNQYGHVVVYLFIVVLLGCKPLPLVPCLDAPSADDVTLPLTLRWVI